MQLGKPKILGMLDDHHTGIRNIDANLNGYLSNYDADIVLLHIGTNDVLQFQSTASTINDMTGIVSKLRADNPNVIILVAKIIPLRDRDVVPLNNAIEAWAPSQNSPTSPLIVVDQFTGFDANIDNFDGIHPGRSGEAKIAARWYEALEPILSSSNRRPVVNAGPDLVALSAGDTLTLQGLASDDGLPTGSTLNVQWSVVSGPDAASFSDPQQAVTQVTFGDDGVYVLRLQASDSELINTDDVMVRVGQVAISGLVGHWPLDDGSGSTTAMDVSGSGSTGTLRNVQGDPWREGQVGGAIFLDGANDDINMGIIEALRPESVTVAAWINPVASSTDWGWIAGEGDNYGLAVNRFAPDDLLFYYYNGGGWEFDSFSNAGISDGEWHHVAGSVDQASGILRLYVDGVEVRSKSTSGNVSYQALSGFRIGSMNGQRQFHGLIDDVRVYSRALEAPEVADLARGVPPEPPVNAAPGVDAGPDRTITLPETGIRLTAQINDDGLPSDVVETTWQQLSGPGTATFTDVGFTDGVLTTDVALDLAGVYTLRLSASDGELSGADEVVLTLAEAPPPPPNQAPGVDAGLDRVIERPANSVRITALIDDDGQPGSPIETSWIQISGPDTALTTQVSFDGTTLVTDITVGALGQYELELRATDGELTGADRLLITLADPPPPPETGPVLGGVTGLWHLDENAGTLAADSSGSGNDGSLVGLDAGAWEPGIHNSALCMTGAFGQQVMIPDPGTGVAAASVTVAGWVKVPTDLSGHAWVFSHGDNYGLVVNHSNRDDLLFYYYTGSTWLSVRFDNTGIRDGQWHHVAGSFDDTSKIAAVFVDGVQVSGRVLTASIDYAIGTDASIGSMRGQRNFNGCLDEIQVYDRALSEAEVAQLAQLPQGEIVNAAPGVDAGPDRTITLPETGIRLTAQINDDGLPSDVVETTWQQLSGPGTATFTDVGFIDGALTTDVALDLAGVYTLRLSASDGELSGADEVVLTLAEAPPPPENQPPSVDAGPDLSVQLPQVTVRATSQVSDDGLPTGNLTTVWTQLDGPGTVSFTEVGLAGDTLQTDITADLAGVYTLRLSASDGELSGADEVVLTLREPPLPGSGPVLDGVAAFWRLDEGTGTQALDDSGSGDHGVLLGLDEGAWQDGVHGSGLCLSGAFGQQVMVQNPGANIAAPSVTVAAWVKVNPALNTWAWVAGHGDNYGLVVNRFNSDDLLFYYFDGANWRSVGFSNTGIRDGQWHHIAGSFDVESGVASIFMNGSRLSSQVLGGVITYVHGSDASIGSMLGQRNFNGCLDEVQIYDRALTDSEVQLLGQTP